MPKIKKIKVTDEFAAAMQQLSAEAEKIASGTSERGAGFCGSER